MSNPDQIERRSARPWILGLAVMAAIVFCALWAWRKAPVPPTPAPVASPTAPEVRLPVQDRPAIQYEALARNGNMKEMMDRRKAEYGIDEALDLVVTGEETLQIGGQTVSVAEIQRQIALREGRIIESEAGSATPPAPDEVYGIHVVQPGDNLWNIHFALLKAYFQRKGTTLAPLSDEPGQNGSSSGVGRLLKFSEGMVYIFNLRERRLEDNIDSIHPRSKIVVYKMGQVFALLDRIAASELDRIRFDGDTLWLPAPR